MKKLFTLLFSVSFLISFLFINTSVQAQLPFSDGFESGNLNNWTADGDTAVIGIDPYEGASCFQGTNFFQMQKTFSPVSEDIITVEFAMKAAQDNKESVDFLVYDESNNALARVYFANMGYIYSKDGVNDMALMVYTWDVWYQVKIIIDQPNQQYDVIIDGDTMGQDFSFVDPSDYASRFYFSGSEADGSVGYIDDVSITAEAASGTERDALLALYNATDGANWTDNTNWDSEAPLGEWYGVTTDVTTGYVTEINMTDNNLIGTLPSDLENLTSLSSLRLDGHQLSGIIPVELYSMANLIYVNLSNNLFSGELSSLIGNMPVIQSLLLYNNQFTGSIPIEIGNCISLTNLDIGDQALTGEIPIELGSLTNLTFLALRGTGLTGGIPDELCNLENLQYLYLDQNELSGEIPAGFGLGLLLELKQFWIDHNNFTGSLPADIVASLPNLDSFVFNSNKFDEVPADFQLFGAVSVPAENNNFTFEDLENLPAVATFNPQNTIHIYDTTILQAGVEGLIQLSFDGSVNNSSYNWFSNGEFVSTTSGNSIIANLSNPGTFYYNLEITNTSFPEFVLSVDSVVVIVEDNANYSTNFDEYIVGDYLAVVDAGWDTWSGTTGGSEDALITSEYAQSAPNSVKVQGVTDVIYRMGNKTSGHHQLSMAVYVPTGNVGYFNVEKTDTPGEEFAMDCNFNPSGEGVLNAGGTNVNFNYNNDAWNEIILIVDLDHDWTTFKVNGTEIQQWQWSKMTNGDIGIVQLGCLDFFANTANGTPYLYFDDVVLSELEPVNCENIGLAGDFNGWGSTADVAMNQNPEEPYKWSVEFILETSSEVKFRQNEEWLVSWGDDTFPSGTAYQEGPNIPVIGGSFFVNFNCNTGDFVFDSENERTALMAIYNATDGANWTDNTNWDSNEPIDTWYGVLTNESGEVDSLWLGGNNLVGSIPYEIGNLSSLISLGMSANTLSGDLPPTIGNLSNLQRLSVSQCLLSGTIPTEIGNLTNLTWLALWQNNFSGEIPASLWGLTQLEYLWLGSNANLGGSIPTSVSDLTNLITIWIDGTQLSGSIPSEIGQLSLLENLKIHDNKMSGEIPVEIGNLSVLENLYLYNNEFKGDLPASIASIDSLKTVLISGNNFEVLPVEWQLADIDTLNVQNNLFSFEDLENLPANGVYDPQDTLSVYDTTQLRAGMEGLIQLDFDNSVSGSLYSWYRNGVFMSTTSGNSIITTESNIGTVYYTLEITNPNFSGFTLNVDSVIVITTDCELSQEFFSENISCNGNNDGFIELMASNGQEPFEYSIDGGANYSFSSYFVELFPGVYDLTIRDNEGCETEVETIELYEPDPIEVIEEISSSACNGNNNGQINLTVFGGTPSYSYSWTGPGGFTSSNEDIANLVAGEYSVTITDANYCEQYGGPYMVTEPNPLSFSENVIDVACAGESNGEIEVIPEGGTPDYMYSLNESTPQSSNIFSGLAGGEYSVSVIDANDCSTNHVVAVNEPYEGLSFTESVTDVLCFGNADGAIDISALGGSPTYEYSIDEGSNYQTSPLFTGLTAGDYQVMVRDASACQTGHVVTVSEPDQLDFSVYKEDVDCYGESNGSIEITAVGGTPDYEYSIDNGTNFQTSNLFTGLAAGNYAPEVRDANGCETIANITLNEPGEALSFTENVTDVSCNGNSDGSITISSTGGTPTYMYSLNESTPQSSNIFSGLAGGEYSVSVIDANGCSTDHIVIVDEPGLGLSFTENVTNVACAGYFDGEIEVIPDGGTPDYMYSLNESTPQSSNIFSELGAGEYNVAVIDANGCSSDHMVIVDEPVNALSHTEVITDILCYGDNSGVIELTAVGGTSPYEYSIDNGVTYQTSNIFTGITANGYQTVVLDDNGCLSNLFVEVNEPEEGLGYDETITDVLCYGDNSGIIELTAFGGTSPYEYSIDDGDTYQTSSVFSDLPAGGYPTMVRDANGCISDRMVFVNEPVDALSFTEIVTDVLCNGDNNGSIEISALGGTPTYEYSIDDGSNYQSSNIFIGLAATEYSVMVRDANGCISSHMVTVNEPIDALSFTETVTDVLCNGDNNGSIEISALGGTPTYEYSIDDGSNYQSSNIFIGLAAAEYSVMVRDANGCISSHIVTVNEPIDALSFTEVVTDVLCNGDNNGSIEISALGGTPTYEYSIDDGSNYQSSNLFTDLAAGDYSVMVRDANGCISNHMVTVNEPVDGLGFTANVTDVTCFGGSDGQIEVSATGGTLPYEYSNDNGANFQSSNIFTGLIANDYEMQILDANACISSQLITVNEPGALPTVSFTGLDAEYCESAAVAILTGNQAPDGSFSGDGITDNGDGTADFDPAIAGAGGPYEIIYSYTDPNGCSNSDTQQTTVNAVTPVSFTGLDAVYCIDNGIVTIIGSEAPDGLFSGDGITDNGDGTADFDPASAGVGGPYDIVYQFIDGNSCTSEAVNQTSVNDLPIVNFTGLDPSYCLGDAVVIITGNQAPDGSFSGTGITDNGDGTADFDPNVAGLGGPYDVTYSFTDGSNCSNSEMQQTSVFDLPTVSFTGLDANYCAGDDEITITGSEAPNGSFSGPGVFNQGDGTALFYPVVAGLGTHDITYSYENANGCIGTEMQSTTVNELPEASFTGLDASYCQNEAGVVLTGNHAPDGVFTGQGISDNGDGTAFFDPAIAGAGGPYEIIYEYTTAAGCSDNEIQEVEVYPTDELSFTSLETSYCDGTDPIELIGSIAPDGSFAGSGITDNGDGTAIFDPNEAGVGGPYSILYSFTNTYGCYSESAQETEVDETPVVSFTGLETAYCIDDATVVLTGDEPLGTFSGQGVIDNGDGTASYNPSLAGVGGPYVISFSYTNPQACTGEYEVQTEVFDNVVVSFTGLEAEYCSGDAAVTITGSEAPFGTFSGAGITDNNDGTALFDPAVAGSGGPYTIAYNYSDGGVCSSSSEETVLVNPATHISFSGLQEAYCHENYNYLITGSEAPDGYFIGQGISNNGDGTAFFNPSVSGVGGPFAISYFFENDNGCNSSAQVETSVIEGPNADFTYDLGGCFEDAIFVDISTSPNGTITGWSWNFDDPDSEANNTSLDQNPLHQFVSNKSSFYIQLAVIDELSCTDTVVQLIEPFSTADIQGTVITNEGSLITDGYVLAFLFSDGVISTQVDSVQLQSDGSYLFEEMASCVDYIFHAYSNIITYPSVIPRWYVDAFYWFDAAPISVAWDDDLVDGIEIVLYETVALPNGSSQIGGGVYYYGSKGEPVKNIDVVLEYDTEEEKGDVIVGYQTTDELGHWNFGQLGEGVFKIKVDIPGLSMDSVYTVEITQPNTIITGLNYYVDPEGGIFVDFTGVDDYDDLPFGIIAVFPNPNNGQFYLEIQKSEHIAFLEIQSVELWDMEGRLVKDLQINFKGERYLSSFELDDVQPGMYFIKVNNKDAVGVKKFVIQR